MTAKRSGRPRITTPGEFGTSGSFIYEIEPLPHQPLQPEYLDCEESAHKQSARRCKNSRQLRNVQSLNLLHQRNLSRLCNGVNTALKYGLLGLMLSKPVADCLCLPLEISLSVISKPESPKMR
jgi:hypothetical protein